MLYQELLNELKESADESYKSFHKRLLKNDNIVLIGVRVPVLRKIAKKYKNEVPTLLTFPDEYYEVTFIKLSAVALLPYESFISYVDECVKLIDNWATCDCFAPKCVQNHKQEFLPFISKYLSDKGEFAQRFALTTLLHFYVEDKYFQLILDTIQGGIDTQYYYVHMAAAWLLAELIIKFYDKACCFLKANVEARFKLLDRKTHNKAVQKACESYRLSDGQKNFIKGLKG